ncbi:MAG: hypothetical protein M1825_004121 [Sarcosagium campestre]|nr:MAG: hypothetical protein M1825_004121 [Sarcosagium campestre]
MTRNILFGGSASARSCLHRLLLVLLFCGLAGLFSGPVSAAPYDTSPATPRMRKRLSTIQKRAPNPPVPSVEECKLHITAPPTNKMLFYTGVTGDSAELYADANGLTLVSDPSVDTDKWLDGSAGPQKEAELLEEAGEETWDIDVEDKQFFDNFCQAVAELSTGRVTVAVPLDYQEFSNSVWTRVEFPALKLIPGVTVFAVPLAQNQNPGAVPLGPERQIWPCEEGVPSA